MMSGTGSTSVSRMTSEIRSKWAEIVSLFDFHLIAVSFVYLTLILFFIVYNLLMDFVFAIFPWVITWKLRMDRAEKYSLCATLSLGMM